MAATNQPQYRQPTDLNFFAGYYNEPNSRARLNAFVREIFHGLDFSPWNNLGYDFAEYMPFSFFQDDRVVANVSASPMNLWVAGKKIDAVQLGTVATLPAFRRRGLIRALIEKAHAHWESSRRLFFLFANETTADFYRQFGYRQVREHTFTAQAPTFESPPVPARLLDLNHYADRELLRDLADRRTSVSDSLGVYSQSWLLMFHAAVVYPQRLYYLESLDTVVIAAVVDRALRLIDVIGERVPPLRIIYPYIGSAELETIEFQFIPDRLEVGEVATRIAPDSLLFVYGDFAIENEPLLFPATSQA